MRVSLDDSVQQLDAPDRWRVMKRSERMAPVQRVLDGTERERARDMAQRSAAWAQPKRGCRNCSSTTWTMLRGFQQTARAGGNVMALRDSSPFSAGWKRQIRQQEQIVAQARQSVAGSTRLWQNAARQVKAVETVVDKWQGDERRHEQRLEQKDTDERAQRQSGARRRCKRSSDEYSSGFDECVATTDVAAVAGGCGGTGQRQVAAIFAAGTGCGVHGGTAG